MAIVDTWDPNQGNIKDNATIDHDVLLGFAKASESGQLDDLTQLLSDNEIVRYRYLMTRNKDDWFSVIAKFEVQTLIHLVRFFTIAETQLTGWEAGSKSPVIWICRELKKRNVFPDSELTQWIKANTDNKFLPYGNLLDL